MSVLAPIQLGTQCVPNWICSIKLPTKPGIELQPRLYIATMYLIPRPPSLHGATGREYKLIIDADDGKDPSSRLPRFTRGMSLESIGMRVRERARMTVLFVYSTFRVVPL